MRHGKHCLSIAGALVLPVIEQVYGNGFEVWVNDVDQRGGILRFSFGKGVHVADTAMWPIECCSNDNTWKAGGRPKTRF